MKASAKPPAVFSLDARGMDLAATLASGQSFSWKCKGATWRGWVAGEPCRVWMENGRLRVAGEKLAEKAIATYFGLDLPLPEIFASFPDDPWLEKARAFAPGLRILRQEPWEALCNFICSSLKQIVQIEQINGELRRTFGRVHADGLHAFPDAATLALATEADLRACKLGFRARHLYVAARQIASGEISLEQIATLPTDQAREELRRIRGVGTKVANCVLLFAYVRLEAFPIDVWVERVLRQLYFPRARRVTPERMRLFAYRHFGLNAGYAQQFLFHWMRTDPLAWTEQKPVARKKQSVDRRRAKLLHC